MSDTQEIAKILRYYSISTTTEAGSGHPTSCLSSADLVACLFFGGHFRFDIHNPANHQNDRFILSKGHSSPLFYSLWAISGAIKYEELSTLRQFSSRLEGHPTMRFPYTEVPTGSLGQGLSVGVGMAITAKYLDKTDSRIFVLLGDSEMAEGSVWEAMAISSYYKLDNLIAIVDINRLGQRGETMHGHDMDAYDAKVQSFGWRSIKIDGHDHIAIGEAISSSVATRGKPTAILARTIKGKGVSFLENVEGRHGKPLTEIEAQNAYNEIGEFDRYRTYPFTKPVFVRESASEINTNTSTIGIYEIGDMVATREAYGNTLAKLVMRYSNVVALDAETSSSTLSDKAKQADSSKFFEMFIAEQNMIGVAVGMAKRGWIPFVSTFAAFLTRGYDQIRMASYARSNIKIIGSHAGVSIGEDGNSQMGLEDMSMFRCLANSVVLYPSDANSTACLLQSMTSYDGLAYLRITRERTSVIYSKEEIFEIGGCKVHTPIKSANGHKIVIIGAGITLHEALKAQIELVEKHNINAVVIDLYSIKPIDAKTLNKQSKDATKIIVVEDHFKAGGIGEAVRSVVENTQAKFVSLAVTQTPCSGKPHELLRYEEIDANAIIKSALA
jgi:transketolase